MKNISLQHVLLTLALTASASMHKAQVYSATWFKGSSTTDALGHYGSPGIPASNNTPGARNGAASWKDNTGTFWLFGGNGYDHAGMYDYLNDLWKYNPNTKEWAFVKGDSTANVVGSYGSLGISSPTNKPGGRVAPTTWVDGLGNLWLFGGMGYDGNSNFGELNDLWKYSVSTNEWTWMGGSSSSGDAGTYGTQGVPAFGNVPGARISSAAWSDGSGNFWLYGGIGFSGANYGDLQDLWKYSPTTNLWTWVKGSANVNVGGNYGTLGTAAPGNLPGGRFACSSWSDASGNLWLFGGFGYDAAATNEDMLNDLWKYNIANNEWTWVHGSNASIQNGTYGTQNVPASGNTPGSRIGGTHWSDGTGNLYLFGGLGYDSGLPFPDNLNDLWKFNTTTNEWTWLKGSNNSGNGGEYGIQGVPSVTNMPGGRFFTSYWIDANNALWLFGGSGVDATTTSGDLNDVWKMETCVAPSLSISSSPTNVCVGTSVTLTPAGAATYSWSVGNSTAAISVTAVPNATYLVIGSNSVNCTNSLSYTLNALPLPTISASSNNASICAGQSAVLSATGAISYSWSTIPASQGQSITVNPSNTTTYVVTGTDANGCSNSYAVQQTVIICTGLAENNNNLRFTLFPNPNKGQFTINSSNLPAQSSLIIYNGLGQQVWKQELQQGENYLEFNGNSGIYFYKVVNTSEELKTGKLIIE